MLMVESIERSGKKLALQVFATATQDFRWTGLTNVTYSVQAATNLILPWSTLGSVASSMTNFGFTNWNAGAVQFYRLAVP